MAKKEVHFYFHTLSFRIVSYGYQLYIYIYLNWGWHSVTLLSFTYYQLKCLSSSNWKVSFRRAEHPSVLFPIMFLLSRKLSPIKCFINIFLVKYIDLIEL